MKRNWALVISEGTKLGFEFWGLPATGITIYHQGKKVAEKVCLTEARQLVMRAQARHILTEVMKEIKS